MANKATGQPVTAETLFPAASFSRPITAYIDYTGETYIGGSRISDGTLRMILSHTSGFTNIATGRTPPVAHVVFHGRYSLVSGRNVVRGVVPAVPATARVANPTCLRRKTMHSGTFSALATTLFTVPCRL